MADVERNQASGELERWLESDSDKTLGSIIELFEIIAALLALELILGRDQIWLPDRWRRIKLAGDRQQRFITRLMKVIRWLERFSRGRLTFLFNHRISNVMFGIVVLLLTVAAFVSPPFSGLDTLPSMGVVVLSLAVLLEDFAFVVAGLILGAAGVVLEIILGRAAIHSIGSLF